MTVATEAIGLMAQAARMRAYPATVPDRPRVAVLIPCRDEEPTIGKVVADCRTHLPQACIYVYDNNSRDATMRAATAAGAVVRSEALQGKGNVVRRMFSDVEADIYVLIDGDDTYDVRSMPAMLDLLSTHKLDMVTGKRVTSDRAAFRPGHRLGNRLLTGAVTWVFGDRVSDLLSGYRVFSRRFVKSFPALTTGFDVETEFTVHALELRMPIGEVPVAYRERPEGSSSKLRTFSDGFRISRAILLLIKDERPLQCFSAIAGALLAAGLALGLPIVFTFLQTGLVPRQPTAILATGFVLLSFLSLFGGLILDSVTRGRREMKRLFYLTVPAVEVADC